MNEKQRVVKNRLRVLELSTITFISIRFCHQTPPSALRAYSRCPPIQNKTIVPKETPVT